MISVTFNRFKTSILFIVYLTAFIFDVLSAITFNENNLLKTAKAEAIDMQMIVVLTLVLFIPISNANKLLKTVKYVKTKASILFPISFPFVRFYEE